MAFRHTSSMDYHDCHGFWAALVLGCMRSLSAGLGALAFVEFLEALRPSTRAKAYAFFGKSECLFYVLSSSSTKRRGESSRHTPRNPFLTIHPTTSLKHDSIEVLSYLARSIFRSRTLYGSHSMPMVNRLGASPGICILTANNIPPSFPSPLS